jgi:CUB domain
LELSEEEGGENKKKSNKTEGKAHSENTCVAVLLATTIRTKPDLSNKSSIFLFNYSCLQAFDKLTIYDSKTPNKSQIIDVFCNNHVQTKVLSNGPHLLIEFESSSVHTSRGFRAKYRFVDFAGEFCANAF